MGLSAGGQNANIGGMTTFNWTYAVAILQVAFGGVGLVTGWIPNAEAMTILMIGLGVFGMHKSNQALGRALGGTRF